MAAVLAFVVMALPLPASGAHSIGYHWQTPKTIYLVDQTGGRFPVRQAAKSWNAVSPSIHIVMRSTCPASSCIYVRARYLPSGLLGQAQPWVIGHHMQNVYVDLSTRGRMSYAKKLSLTCHEMGHALGLGHRSWWERSSCMTNSNVFPTKPDRHDVLELSRIYRAHLRE